MTNVCIFAFCIKKTLKAKARIKKLIPPYSGFFVAKRNASKTIIAGIKCMKKATRACGIL